jgi:hypothetical protein
VNLEHKQKFQTGAGRPKYLFNQSASAKTFLLGVRDMNIFRGLETFEPVLGPFGPLLA